MSTILVQLVFHLGAIFTAAAILLSPLTRGYSLQFLAGCVIIFVLLNRFTRHRHALPSAPTHPPVATIAQTAVLGLALLLLLGYTGGLASPLLSLYFLYFLFVTFVSSPLVSSIVILVTLAFFYLTTPHFGESCYGAILSLLIYAPVAIYGQKIYTRSVADRLSVSLEREKVAYYNLYAERQQEKLLQAQAAAKKTGGDTDLTGFVQTLIPQIDELQKMSRFSENQLVVSSQLTKIALQLRQALKTPAKGKQPSDQT